MRFRHSLPIETYIVLIAKDLSLKHLIVGTVVLSLDRFMFMSENTSPLNGSKLGQPATHTSVDIERIWVALHPLRIYSAPSNYACGCDQLLRYEAEKSFWC